MVQTKNLILIASNASANKILNLTKANANFKKIYVARSPKFIWMDSATLTWIGAVTANLTFIDSFRAKNAIDA